MSGRQRRRRGRRLVVHCGPSSHSGHGGKNTESIFKFVCRNRISGCGTATVRAAVAAAVAAATAANKAQPQRGTATAKHPRQNGRHWDVFERWRGFLD